MADAFDVQGALVALAAQILYPEGTAEPSAPGPAIRIYEGWPTASALDDDLAQGICHVTVFAMPVERNTTRHIDGWQELEIHAPTLTAVIAGQTITIGGTVLPPDDFKPQNVVAKIDGVPYVYAVQGGNSLSAVATGLATAIAAGIPGASSSGAVVTVPAGKQIESVAIGTSGTLIRVTTEIERVFMVTVWANSPVTRRAITRLLDDALSTYRFINLPDQTKGRMRYRATPQTDGHQKALLYRADIQYSVEFSKTEVTTATEVTQITQVITTESPDGETPVSKITINL